MYQSFSKFRKNGAVGQAFAEYWPTFTTIGVFAIIILWALGGWVSDTFSGANTCIETAANQGRVAAECDANGVETANSGNQNVNNNNNSGGGQGGQPNPPAEEPPAEEPPAEEPPAEEPPAEEPPAEEPPAEEPPAEEPPAEEPPAEEPPAEEPPAEQPPAEQPPAEQPPAEQPPAEQPPSNGHPDYSHLTDFPDSGVTTLRLSGGGSDSYVDIKLSGLVNGTFDGWCVDHEHGIYAGRDYTAKVHGEDYTGLVDREENMDLVNWVLNQNYHAKPGFTAMDVQEAIWTLIDDANVNPSAKAQQIVAQAYQNGENFMPAAGQIIGLVVEPIEQNAQHMMIEYQIPSASGNTVGMHVASLNGSSRYSSGKWRADVVVKIVDANNKPIEGAIVSGSFNPGGSKTCTTGSSGTCTLTSGQISTTVNTTTLSITGVLGNLTYDSGANATSSATVRKP